MQRSLPHPPPSDLLTGIVPRSLPQEIGPADPRTLDAPPVERSSMETIHPTFVLSGLEKLLFKSDLVTVTNVT